MAAPKTKKSGTGGPIHVTMRAGSGRSLSTKEIRNISLGGIFLQTNELLAFGEQLSVELKLGRQHPTIRCKGFVIWSTKESPQRAPGMKGVAVRLTDLGVAEMRLIADTVGSSL